MRNAPGKGIVFGAGDERWTLYDVGNELLGSGIPPGTKRPIYLLRAGATLLDGITPSSRDIDAVINYLNETGCHPRLIARLSELRVSNRAPMICYLPKKAA